MIAGGNHSIMKLAAKRTEGESVGRSPALHTIPHQKIRGSLPQSACSADSSLPEGALIGTHRPVTFARSEAPVQSFTIHLIPR